MYFFFNVKGKDFEQSHEFQKFLYVLKQKKDGAAVEVTDLINGQLGALGLIIYSKTLLDVEQNAVARLPHFHGAFLAVGEASENCKVLQIPAYQPPYFSKNNRFNLGCGSSARTLVHVACSFFLALSKIKFPLLASGKFH